MTTTAELGTILKGKGSTLLVLLRQEDVFIDNSLEKLYVYNNERARVCVCSFAFIIKF